MNDFKLHKKLLIILICCSVTTALFLGCDSKRPEYYVLAVSDLHVPQSINLGESITISFRTGLASSCHRYSHIEAFRTYNRVRLIVWAKHYESVFKCEPVPSIIWLDYSVLPVFKGDYYIEIEQPDGSILSDTILVN